MHDFERTLKNVAVLHCGETRDIWGTPVQLQQIVEARALGYTVETPIHEIQKVRLAFEHPKRKWLSGASEATREFREARAV